MPTEDFASHRFYKPSISNNDWLSNPFKSTLFSEYLPSYQQKLTNGIQDHIVQILKEYNLATQPLGFIHPKQVAAGSMAVYPAFSDIVEIEFQEFVRKYLTDTTINQITNQIASEALSSTGASTITNSASSLANNVGSGVSSSAQPSINGTQKAFSGSLSKLKQTKDLTIRTIKASLKDYFGSELKQAIEIISKNKWYPFLPEKLQDVYFEIITRVNPAELANSEDLIESLRSVGRLKYHCNRPITNPVIIKELKDDIKEGILNLKWAEKFPEKATKLLKDVTDCIL